MKDKELRKIVYNTAKEFDEKLEFLYNELCKLSPELKHQRQHDIICKNPFERFTPTFGYEDGSIPDQLLSWKHIIKTKCKTTY